MATQSNVRDTPTLIKRNGADYSSAKHTELIDWLLMLERKDNVLTLPPTKSGGATLLKNDDFRIDYQGYFNSDPYEIGWINLQVQENIPRKVNKILPNFQIIATIGRVVRGYFILSMIRYDSPRPPQPL